MANEFVTRTGLIVSGSTFLPSATSASKGYILSFDDSTKQVYYMATSSVTVTVPGSDTQVIYNNGGSFGASSNFVFSGSNVGIGTTSPQNKLHISGPASADAANIRIDSTNEYGGLYVTENSTFRTFLGYGNAGTIFSNAQSDSTALRAANYLHLGASSAATLTINGSDNVGIGTTSPAYKLDVQGSAGNIARITDGTSHFLFYAGSGLNEIATTGPFLFTVSGSERMRITTAGNVGIGTTSPAAKLDVVGSAGIRVNEDGIGTKVISIRSDFAGVDPAINVSTNNALLLQTNNTERMRIAAGGNVGIGTTSPNAKLDVNGNVIVTGSLTVSGSSTFTNIGPAVFTGSITQNASTASFGGVVGIGTTTPSARLDIAGDSEGRYLEVNAFAGFAGLSSGSSAMVELLNGGDGNTLFIKTENSARNDAAPLAVWTNNNPRLLVRNDGNVGIGTASPSGKLDIVPSSQNGINIARAGGYASIYGSNDLVFETDSVFYFGVYTPRLFSVNGSFYTTVSGDVGVNTSSPTDKFHVQNGRISVTSGSTFGLSIEASGSGGRGGIISTKAGSDWNPVMYFTSQSRVGIGTGTPSTTLDVSGTGRFSGDVTVGLGNALENLVIINGQTYSGVRFQRSSTTKWAIFNNNAGTDFIDFYNYSTNSSAFYISPTNAATFAAGVTATSFTGSFSGSVSAPGSTTQIVYNSGGALAADSGLVYSGSRVGIGTSSPNATLDVNGNVYVRPNGVLYTDTLAGYTSNVVSLAASTNLVTATGRIGVGTANPNSGSLQIYTAASTNQLVLNGGSGYTNVYAGNFVGNLYLATNYYYSGGHVSDDASKRSMEINMTNDEILFATMPAGSPGTRTRLMTISGSQGFIGIGTTTPAATLDVNGGSIIRGNLTLAGGSRYITGDGGDLFIDTENVSGRDILLQTVSGQKVGIGTTTPSYLLDVNGTARFLGNAATSPASIFNNATGASGTAQYYSEYTAGATTIGRIFRGNGASGVVGNGLNIDNYDGFQIRANQLGGSGGTINLLGGNVGINTNVPVAKLHIQESSTARALIQVVGSEAAGDNAGLYFKSAVNYSDAYMKGGVFFSNNGSGHGRGNLILANNNTADGTNVSISDAKLTVTADGDIQVSGSGYISGSLTVAGTITAQKLNVQQITSSVVYSSGSNIFGNSLANTQTFTGSIQATGSSHYFLGSVGIGTTGPGAPLDVYGSLNSGKSIIRVTNSDTVNYITLGAGIPGVSNAGMNFTLDGSSKMVISAGGNVGIGTTSPSQKLEVDGALKLTSNPSVTADASAAYFWNQSGVGPTVGGLKFQVKTNGATTAMTVDNSQRVGIGTDNPTEKLHLRNGTLLIDSDPGTSPGIWMPDINGNPSVRIVTDQQDASYTSIINAWGSSANSGVTLGTTRSDGTAFQVRSEVTLSSGFATDSGTTRLIVLGNGNVGIGTTTPTGRLTVAPYNTVNSSSIEFTDADNAVISSYYSQTFAVDNTNTQSGRQFVFAKGGKGYGTQTKTMMVIDADSGNVGIGTTIPQAALSIVATGSKWVNDNNTFFQPTGSIFLSAQATANRDNWIGIAGDYNSTTGSANLLLQANFRDVGSQAGHYVSSQGISLGNSVFTIGKLTTSTSITTPPTKVEQFRIDGSGNVGISNTSPTYTLTVGKQATSDNTDYAIAVLRHGTGAAPGSWTSQPAILISDQTNNGPGTVDTTGLFSMQLGRFDYTDTDATNASLINITYDGTIGPLRVDGKGNMWVGYDRGSVPTNSGAFGLLVRGGASIGSNYQATTPPSNGAIIEGNVGIGTTSPSYKLDVAGVGRLLSVGIIQASSNSDTPNIAFTNNGTSFTWGTIGGLLQGDGDGALFFNTKIGGSVTEKMRITSAGNVGIGTSSPNAKLQVIGPSLTVNDENTYGLWVSETGDDTKAIILGYDQGIDAGIITAVDKATAWKNLILQPNLGGVGVGTTSPSYKFQVSESIAIENQGTITIESTTFSGSLTGNTNIAFVPTASFKAAFFDYYVASGSVNLRAGTVMAVHNNSTSRYTDTSTADIGTTAAVDFSTSVIGGSLVLTANISSGTWEVKTAYRAL